MNPVLKINFSEQISDSLSEIFRMEFDKDDVVEKWVTHEAKILDHQHWQASLKSLKTFREGLRKNRIELHSDYPAVLVHAVCFLETFTEQGNDPWIDTLADDYLADQSGLEKIKVGLRAECKSLHQQLRQLYLQISAWKR
jgi:hypothetical protein